MGSDLTKIMVDTGIFLAAKRQMSLSCKSQNPDDSQKIKELYQRNPKLALGDRKLFAQFLTAAALFDEVNYGLINNPFFRPLLYSSDRNPFRDFFQNDFVTLSSPFGTFQDLSEDFEFVKYHGDKILDWISSGKDEKLISHPYEVDNKDQLLEVLMEKNVEKFQNYFSGKGVSKENISLRLESSRTFIRQLSRLNLDIMLYNQHIISQGNRSYLPDLWQLRAQQDPDLQFALALAELSPTVSGPIAAVKPIPGDSVMRDLDELFSKNLYEAFGVESGFGAGPIPRGLAIGNAFMQYEIANPFRRLLDFRYSSEGERLRETFRDLLALGRRANKKAIDDRLADINSQMQSTRRYLTGTSGSSESDLKIVNDYALQAAGLNSWKGAIDYFTRVLSRDFKEKFVRFANTPVTRNGFDVLFDYYYPHKYRK